MPQSRVARPSVPYVPKATILNVVKGFRPHHALVVAGRKGGRIEVSREEAMVLVNQLLDGVAAIDRLEGQSGH